MADVESGRNSVDGERTASTPVRRDTEAVLRKVARARGGAVERRGEIGPDDVSLAAVRDGVPGSSAPKRHPKAERDDTESVPVRSSGGYAASREKCHSPAELGRASRAMARDAGGRVDSAAKRQGRADGDGRGAGACGVLGRATRTAGRHSGAGDGSASWAPVRCRNRFTTSAPKRLAYAAGHGAAGAAERSPALERHLAALSCVGALPAFRSRYIPVAVKRAVWRRDQGCCSYVDRHSGRRCGSRYRLEIDHIVPFALGGATELLNLRLHCRAHHRLRHAPRRAHPASTR